MMIEVIRGDITKENTDAIVNAANSSLMGGGGVDGAIHWAGGAKILEECQKIVQEQGECPTGQAVLTTGGKLPARYVIHTVGPVWRGGKDNEQVLLAACYHNSLELALQKDCRTVSFPNISTGVYHFPKQLAATIAVKTVSNFLQKHREAISVRLVCFDDENEKFTRMALKEYQMNRR